MQSGSGTAAFLPEQASIVTEAVARALSLEPTVTALAPIPDSRLVEVVSQLTDLDLQVGGHPYPLGGITPFSLVSDHQPADRIAASGASGIDLLVGSNLDEGNLYLAPLGLMSGVTDDDLRATAALFHSDPDQVVAA